MSTTTKMHKDLPPPEEKVFPAGHMSFQEKGKQKLVIFEGKPYRGDGRALPHDLAWLRKNDYTLTLEAQAALVPPKEIPKTKLCQSCSAENTLEANYCSTCGTPQTVASQVWTPGSGGDGDAIAAFLDPEDPLLSLIAQSNPLSPQPVPRQTVAELGPTMRDATDFGRVEFSQAANQMSPEGSSAKVTPFKVKPVGTVVHGMPAGR